jgi:tRNA pseudouridine55 synthase
MTGPAGADGMRVPGRWRVVDGIVLLDKPGGLSSNQALQQVRRLLQAAKAGHAGTLDPAASGMLPLCLGQATKACGSLLGSSKAYRAVLALGLATETGDAAGAVTREAAVPSLEGGIVRDVLQRFTGARDQVPPMYSALKRQGRPLYELARRGEEVAREPRRVHLERLELLRLAPRELEFEVVCSKGTYVRVLAEEIAVALGTVGHLSALRRLWVDPFVGEPMVDLPTIEQWARLAEPREPPRWLLPVDAAFRRLPRLELDQSQSLHLRQGRQVACESDVDPGGHARAYGPEGRFLGLVRATDGSRIRVERLFVTGANGGQRDST